MLFRGDPNVILVADNDAGHIVAFATPPQQTKIRGAIGQMQKDGRQVDVIGLSNIPPASFLL
jgi:hypothetical protein